MTTEPKDVQLARAVIQAGVGANGLTEAIVSSAHTVVSNYEANLEHVRKRDEKRQRAIDETARRWPELGALGCTMEESEYLFTVSGGELPTVAIDKEDGEIERYCCDEVFPIQSAVALALIDAAGRNTTADRLRALLVRVAKYTVEDNVVARRCTRFERLLDDITKEFEASNA